MEAGQFPVEPTADGSSTFYSAQFGEWFHSRNGAYKEARMTYVQATELVARARRQGHLTVLDVCYGLGYNTAAALEAIWATDEATPMHIVGLELDPQVPRAAVTHGLLADWPPSVQSVLGRLAEAGEAIAPSLAARLLIGDARQTVQSLVKSGFQADVIFFDPFSPPRCPQLWTVEFLAQVAQCLHPEGILVTYSCAAAVRAALGLAGLHIGSIAVIGRRWPSTIATHASRPLDLSLQEQEHLATRAAVPYRDFTLQDSAETIRERRRQEQVTSSLQPTGAWRRRWLPAPLQTDSQ